MRLLNARTYQLQTEVGRHRHYAILSHTWEEEEVLFDDIQQLSDHHWGNLGNSTMSWIAYVCGMEWRAKKGSVEILRTCQQALQDGYEFVWIDTCCINEESSAELSEASNYMFRWYGEASICYVYLSNIVLNNGPLSSRCGWFGRGWTLQELIGPDHFHFYDQKWTYLGSRISLVSSLCKITGIDEEILTRGHADGRSAARVRGNGQTYGIYECQHCLSIIDRDVGAILRGLSIAQRMNWASKRATTRVEDAAYCLLGLFYVSMPLLYGEGTHAFHRLEEAILKDSDDHSILAFRATEAWEQVRGNYSPILAPHPSYFRNDVRTGWIPNPSATSVSLEQKSLLINMLICPLPTNPTCFELFRGKHLGILDCTISDDPLARPAILLEATDKKQLNFRRCAAEPVLLELKSEEIATCKLLRRYADQAITPEVRYDLNAITRAKISITQEVEDLAWGRNRAPRDPANPEDVWCRIWTLPQLMNEENLELLPESWDNVDVEEIVRSVASHENDRFREDIGNIYLCTTGEVILGEPQCAQVKVTVSVSSATFVRRPVLQLNVHAETFVGE